MFNYKVEAEDGVEIDGVKFEKGEVLELDPEVEKVSELLAEGSLVLEVENNENVSEDVAVEPSLPGEETPLNEETPVEEEGLTYNGKKIIGEVTSEDLEGKTYRSFAVEGGETFKVTAAEFADATAGQDTSKI